MTANDTSTGFDWLESNASALHRGEFRILETNTRTNEGTVVLAVDGSRIRHVLIPVGPGVRISRDTRSRGVHLLEKELQDLDALHRYVDVVCVKPHLRHVFSQLVDDMLVEVAKTPEAALEACQRAMSRWRELLSKEQGDVLSDEALAGVFGELWLLNEVAKVSGEALRVWLGPEGGRHDFVGAHCSVEVKTSSRNAGFVAQISGLDQLSNLDQQPLYLLGLRVQRSGSLVGDSVPDLIDRVEAQGIDICELYEKLHRIKLDVNDREYYQEKRFIVLEVRWYEVDDTFPRIVSSSFSAGALPSKVSNLKYDVDLSSAPPAALPAESQTRILNELLGA